MKIFDFRLKILEFINQNQTTIGNRQSSIFN